jgi:hypothetical protein
MLLTSILFPRGEEAIGRPLPSGERGRVRGQIAIFFKIPGSIKISSFCFLSSCPHA